MMALTLPMQAQKVNLSLSAGTDGIGLDAGVSIGKVVNIRTGLTYIPEFTYNMRFGVQLSEDDGESIDENGEVIPSKFTRLSTLLHEVSGIKMNDYVTMKGHPNMLNYKLLIDIHPIPQDRRWYLTTGFYLGSSTVAKAKNSMADEATLLCVSIYNTMYTKLQEEEPLFSYKDYDFYMDPDMGDKILNYGRMGMNIGTNEDGSTYFMEPDAHSMVSARIKVNKFRPYLGFGFVDQLGKSERLQYGIDCGALFWGGTPSVITHEGVDLTKMEHVNGRPGDYVELIKKFKVYPIMSLKIAYRLF